MNRQHAGISQKISAAVIIVIIAAVAGTYAYYYETSKPLANATMVVVGGPTNWPVVYVAAAEGFYKQQGVNLTLITATSGPAGRSAITSGQAQFGVAQADEPLFLKNVGFNFTSVVCVATWANWNMIVRSDLNIKYGDWRALKGLKIGITAPTASTQFVPSYFLSQAGLNPNTDVTWVTVGGIATTVQAMKAGTIDAFMAYPPISEELVNVSHIAKIFYRFSDNPTWANACLGSVYVSGSYLAQHKDIVGKVVKAIVEAMSFTRENPSKAAGDIAKYYTGANETVLSIMIQDQVHNGAIPLTGSITAASMQIQYELLVAAGQLPASVSTSGTYTNEFVS